MAEGGQTARVGTAAPPRRKLWLVELYQTDTGRKYVMALTGIIMLGYILVHMIGNLKLYLGAESMNDYGTWLRDFGEPALPRETVLWAVRVVLVAAVVFHIDAAYRLARSSWRSRDVPYRSKRDYVAADFASRTMRWTGPIVALFIVFHILDLTTGTANPDFHHGAPYENLVASFERTPVAIAYIVANLALGFHIWHGTWSLFQSMGWNGTRLKMARRQFANLFTLVVIAGNISFPIAVMTGLVP